MSRHVFTGIFMVFACACAVDASDGVEEGADAGHTACSTYGEGECAGISGCIPIMGRPHDASAGCVGDEVFVACWDENDTRCGDSIVGVLADEDGACWFQYGVCGPIEWVERGEGECADVAQAPVCGQ